MAVLTIRHAEPNDAAALSRMLEQLGYKRPPAAIESDLRAEHDGTSLVAVDERAVVGFLSIHVRYLFHRGAPIAEVDALIVDRHARSAGIGASLVAAAVAHARQCGCATIELHSNRRRRRARRFYERHGFVVTSNHFVRSLS